ncbi:MAG: hypothetical protein ACK5TG_15910 [Planctomyces sp.]|jgi:hypothetical protein
MGSTEVRIVGLSLGKVEIVDLLNEEKESQNELLSVTLEIANLSETKKLEYTSWRGSNTTLAKDFATVADNYGNDYRRVNFGVGSIPVGVVQRHCSNLSG